MAQSYQNLTYFATFFVLFSTLHLPSAFCGGQWVILDTASDLRGQWKLQGDSVYFTVGGQLRDFSDKLPPAFGFKSVEDAIGVWFIFHKNNETFSNNVTFSFATSAQLLDNVKIRFNAAGKSTSIKITSPNTSVTLTPRVIFSGWVQEEISLGNTNRFTIQASTQDDRDFILIDRIIVTFLETTTSHRPRSSTTTTPLPKSDGSRPTAAALTAMILISFLMSL